MRPFGVRQLAAALPPRACSRSSRLRAQLPASKLAHRKAAASRRTPKQRTVARIIKDQWSPSPEPATGSRNSPSCALTVPEAIPRLTSRPCSSYYATFWSAAACCRFTPASLLAVISAPGAAPGQQAGSQKSGGKPPHSKTTDCRSHHQDAVVAITRASYWLAKLSKLRIDRARAAQGQFVL